jgi:Domain of unknown function (4846)
MMRSFLRIIAGNLTHGPEVITGGDLIVTWCGTASLEKQLNPVKDIKEMKPGDVFIKGGFPGHAMIVADVAMNNAGEKIFILAQSYMPAQDIHVVINPDDEKLSPWYMVDETNEINTPEWIFKPGQLRKW